MEVDMRARASGVDASEATPDLDEARPSIQRVQETL
jgi:hypothetical protein